MATNGGGGAGGSSPSLGRASARKTAPDVTAEVEAEVEQIQRQVPRLALQPAAGEAGRLVRLNVGGMHFTTTAGTLTKDTSTMLHTMFSGRFSSARDPASDAYFIDRDGTHFRYVLNYLRDGSVELMNEPHQLREILREAIYFQIEGLIQQIMRKLKSLREKRSRRYRVRCLGQNGLTTKKLNQMADDGYEIESICVDSIGGLIYAVGSTQDQAPEEKEESEVIASNVRRSSERL